MSMALSVQLREGTKESHRLAERTAFIQKFFSGQLTVEEYKVFLVQLYYVYSALEEKAEANSGHEDFGKVHFDSLHRKEALMKDLNYFYKNDSWKEILPSDATKAYVERIRVLSNSWVQGLIAHHYTRYLGDLSGGQVLKRIVAKTFNLSDGEGLAFYDFPEIEDHAGFKEAYRQQMDSIQVDSDSSQKIVDEANLAFQLNRDVFASMMQVSG